MTLLIEPTSSHKGKVIDRFENEHGIELSNLNMCDDVVIVFTDGTRLRLGVDGYGVDSYISQYEDES